MRQYNTLDNNSQLKTYLWDSILLNMLNCQKILLFFILFTLVACQKEEKSFDLIITNANIYPITSPRVSYDAIGIKDGRISFLGDSEEILKEKQPAVKHIDAGGKFLMPGLIEGHGHFSNLGKSIQNLNFLGDTSWQQVTKKVEDKLKTTEPGEWIYGRGWHQEKFTIAPEESVDKYPTHATISNLSKDNPVILVHASGHSLFANEKAMEIAGISKESPNPAGGKIIRDQNKNAVGVFEERAMTPVLKAYDNFIANIPEEKRKATWKEAIALAEEECLEKGITSFQDAGSKFYEAEWYEEMARNKELDLRLWTMIRHSSEEMENKLDQYRMINVGEGFYTCRAIKSELDGALGAHGAWLLEEYSDKPGFLGQNTTEILEVDKIAGLAFDHNMQLCVHAIGDRANRMTLNIFEKYKDRSLDADMRWRVEHAQHLSPDDIPRFKELGAIASMQGVHCTSDAPFVALRLGGQRAAEGAYAWRALLDAGAVVVNGTDAPVEDVDPLASIYASVTRKRNNPDMDFFPEQKMTREEAIYSYTMAPAFAAFEENEKGSIEVGKYADLILLDKNLLTCDPEEIRDIKVLYTIVNGEVKYNRIKE